MHTASFSRAPLTAALALGGLVAGQTTATAQPRARDRSDLDGVTHRRRATGSPGDVGKQDPHPDGAPRPGRGARVPHRRGDRPHQPSNTSSTNRPATTPPAQRYQAGGNVGGLWQLLARRRGHRAVDRSDVAHRRSAERTGADPAVGARHQGLQPGQQRRPLPAHERLGPLLVAGGAGVDAAGRLQQRLSDRADPRLRDHPARDDPRRPHHPDHRSTVH